MSFRKQRPKPNLNSATRRKNAVTEDCDCVIIEDSPTKHDLKREVQRIDHSGITSSQADNDYPTGFSNLFDGSTQDQNATKSRRTVDESLPGIKNSPTGDTETAKQKINRDVKVESVKTARNLKARPKPNIKIAIWGKRLRVNSSEKDYVTISCSNSESESSQPLKNNSQNSVIVISSDDSQPIEVKNVLVEPIEINSSPASSTSQSSRSSGKSGTQSHSSPTSLTADKLNSTIPSSDDLVKENESAESIITEDDDMISSGKTTTTSEEDLLLKVDRLLSDEVINRSEESESEPSSSSPELICHCPSRRRISFRPQPLISKCHQIIKHTSDKENKSNIHGINSSQIKPEQRKSSRKVSLKAKPNLSVCGRGYKNRSNQLSSNNIEDENNERSSMKSNKEQGKSSRKALFKPKSNVSVYKRRYLKKPNQMSEESSKDENIENNKVNSLGSKSYSEVSVKRVRVNPKTTCKHSGKDTSEVIIEIERKDAVNSDAKASDISLELPSKESQLINNSFEVEHSTAENVTTNGAKSLSKSNDNCTTSANQSSHYRRPNSVKPNLSTANRIVRTNQCSPSYGKFANVAKQRFRNKFGTSLPEHSKLTMLDLIFYNPPNNPMSGGDSRKKSTNDEIDLGPVKENEPDATKVQDNDCSDKNISDADMSENDDSPVPDGRAVDQNGVPVPQLKVTADGKVIIAPESLVVAGSKEAVNPESRPLIMENDLTHHKVSSNKMKRKITWTFQETIQFYKVLQTTGADFSSMAEHFPERTRNCLKRKFKKEEKINSHLIDKVLGTSNGVDFKQVERDLALNKMLDQLEKSCKKRTEPIPDILEVCDGVNPHLFLTKKEKLELKKKNENSNDEDQKEENKNGYDEMYLKCILNNDRNSNCIESDASNNNQSVETMKKECRRKRRKQVLNLKEIFSINNESSTGIQTSTLNRNKKRNKKNIFNHLSSERNRNKLIDLENGGSQEEMMILETSHNNNNNNENGTPIVVNTSIEATNIKYTKSITFNLNNMETPVDINETIAHIGGTEFPHSTYIINEIVDILSNEDQSFYAINEKK